MMLYDVFGRLFQGVVCIMGFFCWGLLVLGARWSGSRDKSCLLTTVSATSVPEIS